MSNPGFLYVIATLLPLASFLLLFAGGKRWPGRVGGLIAVGGIGGAFVCSLIGFLLFLGAMPKHGHHDDHAKGAAVQATTPAAGSGTQPTATKPAEPGKEEAAATKPAEAAHGHGHAHAHADDHDHDSFAWKGSLSWVALTGFGSDDGGLDIRLGYYIDSLGAIMFLMVTFIASLIHIFALGYMSEELQPTVEDHQAHVTRKGRFPRFFMWFSLFCFSMLNLVLADNLFQVFVSWELVGVCSFGLIGFYYERQSATNAANKAFITNRVGDAGFIIGLLILWTQCGTLTFHTTTETVTTRSGRQVEKVKQLGIFDALRAPEHDTHKDPIKEHGQFVRVRHITEDDDHLLQMNPAGDHVVIWDKATLNGHFHGPDEKGRFEAYLSDRDGGHGHGMKTMPYWMLVLAGVGIFLGCVGKSAQFPLQVWLPDAMEGPTPVSALVHSATMVAAGVYLVGRVYPLFAPEVLLTIAYVGAITAFIAATIAIVQTDIKKVLAYSTVSQLGFMMLGLGVGGWVYGLFHLLTHAFFKALLFLGSGSVIHGCHHEQEMTKMGGLHAKMRTTSLTMLVGVLAICGTPLFSGWYSKDGIIVAALSFASLNPEHMALFLLPLIGAGITAFYMFRLWFVTFTPRDEHVYEHAHESPRVMTVPLIILAVCSVVVAWGPRPWDVQGSALEHFVHHSQPESLKVDTGINLNTAVLQAEPDSARAENVIANTFARDSWLHPLTVKLGWGPHDLAGLLALVVAGLGVLLSFAVYYWRVFDPQETRERFPWAYDLFQNKWHFDALYSALLVRPTLVVGYWCKAFDQKVIDGLIHGLAHLTVLVSRFDGKVDNGLVDGLVNLTGRVVFGVGDWLKGAQTGLIRNYVLFMAVAAVGIFAVVSYVLAMAG
ncbi:MAG TPA: proton-conducting transporter membrane subunit [Gemmatales bacterium]|nr:proton-conducting transporter membrane subunit [Gemmatales bacterium]